MADNTFTAPFFQLFGRKELHAEGVMTLMEYSKERVVLLCRGIRVRIWGSELQVALLSQSKAVISGVINGFEFF
ncbi:MAG: YabP/YqfC family sporulation protein [Clostridia bacterium]|nr:YabP/YqfC family sporulation protein [Clostridia bacterium]